MRSACSALLIACACGNLSNEDVAFIEAIPEKSALHVAVPGSSGQTLCLIGTADFWINARTTGDSINAGVDAILTLVDSIRSVPPTTRDTDQRTWGPFPDDKHPGVVLEVTMFRELNANGVPWRWIFTISARRPPGAFLPILEGEFFSPQARNGIGRITFHFENSWALGIQSTDPNHPDPKFPMRIFYDLSGDPHTISLDLTGGAGLGLPSFDYAWAGYADGHGQFDYALPDAKSGCLLELTTFFTPTGAGHDVVRANCGGTIFGDVVQCWDASACLTYVDDPFAFTAQCLGLKPCLLGNPASCPP